MIAIIPARGGSKGLPGKNIKLMGDKPLIAHTIQAALSAKHISRVIVSTDCEEIAEIGKRYGAEVPFMRPPELAEDHSLAIDTYLFTIGRLMELNEVRIDDFVVLLPTSPFRNSSDIDHSIELFNSRDADSVISFSEAPHPPHWAKKISVKGTISDYFAESNSAGNRQELEKAYMPNGAIYIFRYNLLRDTRKYYNPNSQAYIMPIERSIDIDSEHQFTIADLYLKYILNGVI